MEALESTYASPEVLVGTYCPELSVFFTLFGDTLTSDSSYVSVSELPNPFGGRNFPATVTKKIENYTNDVALISIKQSIPQKDLTEIMTETMRELSKMGDRPFNESEVPKINMTTVTNYSYDIEAKKLKQVLTTKLIETDALTQKQTIKVTAVH
jgi:hypothetical protein